MKKVNIQELFLWLFVLFILASATQRWWYKGQSVSGWYKSYSQLELKYRTLLKVNDIIQEKQRKILNCMWGYDSLSPEEKDSWKMADYCVELAKETSESTNARQ